MSKRSANRIRKAILIRQKAEARITKIRGQYQPRIDKITLAMNLRAQRWINTVRTADTVIREQLYTLNGRELATLRRQFPDVRELGGSPLTRKEKIA